MIRDALVVGVNRYPFLKDSPTNEAQHLTTPAFDAEALAYLLETHGNFTVRRLPENLIDGTLQVDQNKSVTAGELEDAIAQLFNPAGDSIPDTALLFFAGHGWRRQRKGGITEGYLATSEANRRKEQWGVSLQWLRQLLKKSPVQQQIIMLDCCNSGELFNFAPEDLQVTDSKKIRFFITAAREFENAYPSLKNQQGALTELLLIGLDPHRSSEGSITSLTLKNFIEQQRIQVPQKPLVYCDNREILLTSTPDKKYRLEQPIRRESISSAPHLTWRVHTLIGHSDVVKSVAISPDSKILASGSFDQTIKLWQLDTGQLIDTLTGHSGTVTSLAFSPDGQTLASSAAYPDGTIKLWNLSTRRLQRTLKDNSLIVLFAWSVAFSPDGQTLASGYHSDHTIIGSPIKLWHLPTGELLHTLNGHTWGVRSVAFTSDGRTLASGGWDGIIRLWNLRTKELKSTLHEYANLFDRVSSFFQVLQEGRSKEIQDIAISSDGQVLATGGKDKTVKLWRINTEELRSTLIGHSDTIESVVISPDGQTVVSGSADQTIRIWNLHSEKLLCVLTEHSDTVYSLAFSPDAQTLVSSSADMTVKIWRLSF